MHETAAKFARYPIRKHLWIAQNKHPGASESGDDLLAKQQALLELERLRRQGVTLTRQYTVRDRIEDIEFEVKRHCMHIEEETTLNFMRDAEDAFGAIELANNKLGPWLDLDGWSSQMTSDMSGTIRR